MFCFIAFSQNDTLKNCVEYATVHMKIYYQGNTLKNDKKGISKSPTIYFNGIEGVLIDNTDENNPKDFKNSNEILNYMAKFGWILKTSNIVAYAGDSGNNDTGLLLNTNEYMQLLIFEKIIKCK